MGEIRDLFVEQAPHRDRRELIFDSFKIHFSLVRELFSSGKLWVNGGFCTHKPEPPKDIDMVIVVDPHEVEHFGSAEWERLVQLLTLQGVSVEMPAAAAPRVQPMGGLIDCFFILSTDLAANKMWDQLWSSVKRDNGEIVPGLSKGYLEVSW